MNEDHRSGLVFLIGPRGAGKSTVARLLAESLGREFVDADVELETRAGRSIREVFDSEGEAGFRRREAMVLADLSERRNCVVATGGGAILSEDNRRALGRGTVVLLIADADVLWQRINADATTALRRPALTSATGRDEVLRLLAAREPLYRAAADLIVETTSLDPTDTAREILSHLNGKQGN